MTQLAKMNRAVPKFEFELEIPEPAPDISRRHFAGQTPLCFSKRGAVRKCAEQGAISGATAVSNHEGAALSHVMFPCEKVPGSLVYLLLTHRYQ